MLPLVCPSADMSLVSYQINANTCFLIVLEAIYVDPNYLFPMVCEFLALFKADTKFMTSSPRLI